MTATAPEREDGHDEDPRGMPSEFDAKHIVRRLIALAIFLVLVGFAIRALPGLGELRHRFGEADAILLAVIALCKLASCLSNVLAFRDVFCPRMDWMFSYELAMAEQGTNVLVPTGGAGGLALGAWALRQGNVPTEHIARRSVCFFVLTSIPNFAVAAILGPLLLTGWFHGSVSVPTLIVFSALAWIMMAVVAAMPLWLGRIDHEKDAGPVMSKVRVAAHALDLGIRDVGTLIATRRWRAIFGAFGYLFFDIGALLVGFAAFGGGLPLAPIIFAYVIGQLGGLIPLPAGIGGTDGGLIGALVLFGAPVSQAAAAVLAYRLFQLCIPAVLGAIAFIGLRRRLGGSQTPELDCAPLSQETEQASRAARA